MQKYEVKLPPKWPTNPLEAAKKQIKYIYLLALALNNVKLDLGQSAITAGSPFKLIGLFAQNHSNKFLVQQQMQG